MSVTKSFTIMAEPMIPPEPLSFWRRFWLRVRRRELPKPTQPIDTHPMVIDYIDTDGRRCRMFFPAARTQPESDR